MLKLQPTQFFISKYFISLKDLACVFCFKLSTIHLNQSMCHKSNKQYVSALYFGMVFFLTQIGTIRSILGFYLRL